MLQDFWPRLYVLLTLSLQYETTPPEVTHDIFISTRKKGMKKNRFCNFYPVSRLEAAIEQVKMSQGDW